MGARSFPTPNYGNTPAAGVRSTLRNQGLAAMSMPLAKPDSVSQTKPTLVVKPLSPALGAEIAGIDLRDDLSAQTVAALIDAWHRHLVIVFRDQIL
jgi:hypothetical protein